MCVLATARLTQISWILIRRHSANSPICLPSTVYIGIEYSSSVDSSIFKSLKYHTSCTLSPQPLSLSFLYLPLRSLSLSLSLSCFSRRSDAYGVLCNMPCVHYFTSFHARTLSLHEPNYATRFECPPRCATK